MTKATPRALKVLRGNPGRRPLSDNEPLPDKLSSLPPAPDFIKNNVIACAEWDRLGSELAELGILTNIDMAAFMGYCLDFARWMEAELDIEENGILSNGLRNPAVLIADQYQKSCFRFMGEFGMTPSSRSKLIVPNKNNKEDPMEALITKSASRKATDE